MYCHRLCTLQNTPGCAVLGPSPLTLLHGLSSVMFEISWSELASQIFLSSAKNLANICHLTRNSCVITALTG